jgi:hypothetical protein
MAIILQPYLFSWKEIEAASDLDRLRLVLDSLPDESLVSYFEIRRANGRDDYPIRAVWNAVIAGIIFDHSSIASLRRELLRNGELRWLCGFDPGRGAKAVPTKDAFSRFISLLLVHDYLLDELFHALLEKLGQMLPDLGEKLAVDSKAIESFAKPIRIEDNDKEPDGRRDVDADWGVKTYQGQRDDGNTWEKIKSWYGYKLHLIVDSIYELPLGYLVTKASTNDNPTLLPLLQTLKQRHPDLVERAKECSADKGYDSTANNTGLYDDYGIKPVIDIRNMWKEDKDTSRPLYPDKADVFTYDESGQIYCHCPTERRDESEKRDMVFVGFEKGRNTLKYRCPAAYYGLDCIGRTACEENSGVGVYGRSIRVPIKTDRRIFTPIARHTPKWQKAYAQRTAVERVNSRVDQLLGFEHHNIRGQKKMQVRLSMALVVMLAMALGRIRIGQKDKFRSLVAPVEKAA